jgi:hypothetical protein
MLGNNKRLELHLKLKTHYDKDFERQRKKYLKILKGKERST